MQGWVLSGGVMLISGVMVMVIFCRTLCRMNVCRLQSNKVKPVLGDVGSVGHNLGGPSNVVHMGRDGSWMKREEQEPTEDFLNDENEPGNRETGIQDVWWGAGHFDLNSRKIKKGVPMKRSKSVRKMKAIKKAISKNEKSEEKITKSEKKMWRTKSAKLLYE
ncbi:hypothetical protein IFM89_025943 [Coptis chinensis]|uniref:Uncharacterized protein n=1 Tax=Coptis chinensis TaxID=261450 RepID=A0A835HS69_9MAGN|nr:hypothetical protein IFM89_025943 [Coptis chinensis]